MTEIKPASRFDSIEISLIRQINALAREGTINLGIGEPNVEPTAALRELARAAASSGSWRYTANAGALSLRKQIIRRYEGADAATETCVTAGTQEGLYAVMQAFIEPGDEVLIPDPGFLAYGTLVTLAGGLPVTYRLTPPGWELVPEEVLERMTARTKMIVVNSPSNPTGAVMELAPLRRLAALAEERGILLVSDEVYAEVFESVRPPTAWGLGGNVVILSGLSKSHSMTGLRLGWVIAPAELMKTIVKAHQYIATCASAFSQNLAEAILADDETNSAWLVHMRAQFSMQRRVAVAQVEQRLHSPLMAPGGGFFLFVPVPSCDTAALARSLATEARVLVIPGVAFGESGEGYLRISYAASAEMIQEGVRRIEGYLRQLENRALKPRAYL